MADRRPGRRVRAFLKNRPMTLLTIGMVLMATSPAWEYIRVRPDYQFIVSPWSIRGYQFTQGKIIAVTATVILVLALLMAYRVITESTGHATAVVVFMVLYAMGVAAYAGVDDVILGGFGVVLVAILAAIVIGVIVVSRLPERIPKGQRNAIKVAIWIVGTFVLARFVLSPLFGGTQRPLWMVFLLVFGIIGTFSLVRPPRALAPWRTVINAIAAIWLTSITMVSSLRFELLQMQRDVSDIATGYGDVGITSGVLLAWLGGLLGIVGAVGMWAKRRDEIDSHERARRQQAAARESEAQLAGSSV